MYEFIGTIAESKLIPSQSNLRKYTAHDLSELVVLYLCSLYILHSYKETKKSSTAYVRRTTQYGVNWEQWKASGTDLYVALYGLKAKGVELKAQDSSDDFKERMPFGEALLNKWLKEFAAGNITHATHRALFTKLDSNFKITNSSIRAVRRLVMDWDQIDDEERSLAMTRLIQLMKFRAPRSELIGDIQKVSKKNDLEITDVCDKDSGKNCDGFDASDYSLTHNERVAKYGKGKKKDGGMGFLVAVAGIAAGIAAADALDKHGKSKVKENSTGGATGSSSIATAPGTLGGIGVGFDPNGDKGIYNNAKKKKAPIIRR